MLEVIVRQHLDKPHVIVREAALETALLSETEINLEPTPDTPLTWKGTPGRNITPLTKKKSDLTVGVY